MNKHFAIALIAFIGTGCSALRNETLLSELRTGTPSRTRVITRDVVASKMLPAGSPCQFGSDCASSACEQNLCEDIGDSGVVSAPPMMLAGQP